MLRFFCVILLVFAIAGCDCTNQICDCFDECDSAIPFSFSTDSLANGFRISEIDTIILYKLPKGQPSPADSIYMYLDLAAKGYKSQAPGNSFCGVYFGFSINETGPFRTGNFDGSDYLIKVPGSKTFKISEIVEEGKVAGGCCSCYTNTKKILKVDGVVYDLSGKAFSNAIKLSR